MKLENEEEISAYYKGLFIHKTIDLESLINVALCNFFVKDEQEIKDTFFELLDLTKIDFHQKKTMISYILKKHLKDFESTKTDLGGDKTKFLSELTYVMERRNEIAHKVNKTPNWFKLDWKKIDNGKIKNKEMDITHEYYNKFDKTYWRLYNQLIELNIEISNLK